MFLGLSIVTVLLLAYANGANDNFKGVATLYGAGTATYRSALVWSTVTTTAGAVAALFFAQGLIAAFSGKGLVPDAVASTPAFPLAVVFGAAATVLIATKVGFPVSTTHALTGGLIGAGFLASPAGVDLSKLGSTFFAPLLGSPVIALVLAAGIYPVMRMLRLRSGLTRQSCVCVEASPAALLQTTTGEQISLLDPQGLDVMTGPSTTACANQASGAMVGIDAGRALDKVHYLSAGAVAFSRALNDTPKIAAILLTSSVLSPGIGILLVALFMAVGGLLHSRKLAETMAHRVTTMSPGQGLTANLVTGALVILASKVGLPVSTTHVACGSLFGIGTVTRNARWQTIASILVAWVTTLPAAAILSAVAYWSIQRATMGS